MKTAVIILLGNRDIQITKEKFENVIQKYSKYFVPNQDGDKNYFIVDKFNANKTDLEFIEISKLIWENYDYFKTVVEYTLWELTYNILKNRNVNIDKVYISTSKQNPPNKQDTFYFAYSIEKYLKEIGFEVQLELCAENPTDFEKMNEFYVTLFDSISKQYDKLYISNTGGTPAMRTASHFAGLFRNYEYIAVNSDDSSATKTFKKQENLILKQIVEKMLTVYDYAGIEDLPLNNPNIKYLAKYALSRIHLNYTESLESINLLEDNDLKQDLTSQVSKEFAIKDLERELFLTAKIKFLQKAYADYLWRLFTIQDNILIPILEEYFNEKIIFNKPDHPEWNLMLNKYPNLMSFLETAKFGKYPLDYSQPNKFAYKKIYSFVFQSNPNVVLNAIDAILTSLSDLRNAIAHNYGSIGYADLDKSISESQLRKALTVIDADFSEDNFKNKIKELNKISLFNTVFGYYLGLNDNDFGIYDQINRKILELL